MNKNEKAKMIIGQTMVISIGMLLVIGVEGLIHYFQGEELFLSWYQAWAILFVGFLTALPTVFWLGNEKLLPEHPTFKIVLHFFFLYGVIALAGWLLEWYTSLKWFIIMSLGFIGVYVMVWVITLWFLKQEEDSINRKLEEIQDEE